MVQASGDTQYEHRHRPCVGGVSWLLLVVAILVCWSAEDARATELAGRDADTCAELRAVEQGDGCWAPFITGCFFEPLDKDCENEGWACLDDLNGNCIVDSQESTPPTCAQLRTDEQNNVDPDGHDGCWAAWILCPASGDCENEGWPCLEDLNGNCVLDADEVVSSVTSSCGRLRSDQRNNLDPDGDDGCWAPWLICPAMGDCENEGFVCLDDLDHDCYVDLTEDNCPVLWTNTNQANTDGDGAYTIAELTTHYFGALTTDPLGMVQLFLNVLVSACNVSLDPLRFTCDLGSLAPHPATGGDACDIDLDNDGFPNAPYTDAFGGASDPRNDNCDGLFNPDQADLDADGFGDRCDSDDDGDLIADSVDRCPLLRNSNNNDADGDGIGDPCDPLNELDLDGDGVRNVNDNCPFIFNPGQANSDGDAAGDACDPVVDSDGDSVGDDRDNCPLHPNATQADDDSDGLGNACDPINDLDVDGDGVLNVDDNCPFIRNATQADDDEDGFGNDCDSFDQRDIDSDGVFNPMDNCPFAGNPDQLDTDDDGLGDVCDPNLTDGIDADGDGIRNDVDNCPFAANSDQIDRDGDGIGDPCDPLDDLDIDGDGVRNSDDNCPFLPNPAQIDEDGDGFGDACSDLDEDGIAGRDDNCPIVVNPTQEDSDGDGFGDLCDDVPYDARGGGCSAGHDGGPATGTALAFLVALVTGLAVRRRRRRRAASVVIGSAAVAAGLAFASHHANAQSVGRSYPVERLQLVASRGGILDVESPTVLPHLTLDALLSLSFADQPFNIYAESGGTRTRVGSLVDHRIGAELAVALGLGSRSEIGLSIPLVLSQGRDLSGLAPTDAARFGGPLARSGLGDIQLRSKVSFLRAARHGVDGAVTVSVGLPTSTSSDFFGDPHLVFEPGVALGRDFGAVRGAVELGYRARERTTITDLQADLTVDDELTAAAGLGVRLAYLDGSPVSINGSLAVAVPARAPTLEDGYTELKLGAEWDVPGPVIAFAGGGLGHGTAWGTPDWRALAGIRFEGKAPSRAVRPLRAAPVPETPTVITVAQPQAAITIGSTEQDRNGVTTFVFQANQAGSTFECSLDGGEYRPCISPVVLSDLADGAHSFSVRATDPAGNVDPSPARREWVVDVVPPTTEMVSGPDFHVASTTATFVFGPDDPDVTFECSLDARPYIPCTTPYRVTGLAQGQHQLEVVAIDRAGNRDGSPAIAAWYVDTVAPQIRIVAGPPWMTAQRTATFELTSSEPGTTFECSLDDAPYTTCADRYTVTVAAGNHVLAVRAADVAGNVGSTPETYAWVVDTMAPKVEIQSGPSGTVAGRSSTFTFCAGTCSDAKANAEVTFECSVDEAPFATCASPFVHDGAPGAHTFAVRARDRADNIGPSSSRSWAIDATPPSTRIVSGPPNLAARTHATFVFASNDSTATFECSLDRHTFVPCASVYELDNLTQGAHELVVRARDAAGNVDPTTTRWSWTVDTAPPDTRLR